MASGLCLLNEFDIGAGNDHSHPRHDVRHYFDLTPERDCESGLCAEVRFMCELVQQTNASSIVLMCLS